MYLSKDKGGRGLQSDEQGYKLTKIKAVIKLYQNTVTSMRTVQMFKERVADKAHSSLVTEAHKYAEELGISLPLKHPDPSCNLHQDQEVLIEGTKVKKHLKNAMMEKLQQNIKAEKW